MGTEMEDNQSQKKEEKKSLVKVIYFAGYGRSGSTLLDLIFGEMTDFFSVGEIGLIWERSFINNELCSCSLPFSDCDFWNNVKVSMFGENDSNEIVYEVLKLQKELVRVRHIPKLLFKCLRSKKYNERLKYLCDVLGRLYEKIGSCSEAEIIVDSTKLPLYALLLCNVPNVELSVVHLVRNSKAVAYSWKRKRIRPEIQNKIAYMPTYSSIHCAKEWNKNNLIACLLKYFSKNYCLIKYEDFIKDPSKHCGSILRKLKLSNSGNFICKDNSFVLKKESHTVSGNPLRFNKSKIEIKGDIEWEKNLSLKDKILINIFTFPVSKLLGY